MMMMIMIKAACGCYHCRPSHDKFTDVSDDRYRELMPPAASAAVRDPPSRRRFTRSPMLLCIRKQDSQETPIFDGIAAQRNNSQVRFWSYV